MVAATTLKARLTGNLVEKHEDVVKREAMERINAERKATVTAAKLLADAAQSLGLPRDASPAMIVGALAEHPIPTPEAFRLCGLPSKRLMMRSCCDRRRLADLLACVDADKRGHWSLLSFLRPQWCLLLSLNTRGLSAFSARSILIRACIRKSRTSAVSIRQ